MAGTAYGPFVVSDVPHYADKDDLEELLRRRFPSTAEQPFPWRYTVCYWSPSFDTRAAFAASFLEGRTRLGKADS